MNLFALRKELREGVLRDVSDAVGGDDAFYADTQLNQYLSDGYGRVMHRLLPVLKDGGVDVTFEVAAGERMFELPPNVKLVRAAYVEVSGERRRPLTKYAELPVGPGIPAYYSLAANSGMVTIAPVPDERVVVVLSIAALETTGLTKDKDVPVAIPEPYHYMLVNYAAAKAMAIYDADRTDEMLSAKASGHRNEYQRALKEVLYFHRRQVNLPTIGFSSEFR